MFEIVLILSFWIVVCTTQLLFTPNPLIAALQLMLIFILTGLLIIVLQAEFLGILYILVYAGAITVLFLFVIMMCNLREFNPTNPNLWKNQFLSQKNTRIVFGFLILVSGYFYASFLIEQYFLTYQYTLYNLEKDLIENINTFTLLEFLEETDFFYLWNKSNSYFMNNNLDFTKLMYTCEYYNIHPMHIFFSFEFLQNNMAFAKNLYSDSYGFIFVLCTLCLLVAMLGPTILTRTNRLING